MSGAIRVVGIGGPAAGDDGAGPAVVDLLREGGLPEGVELHAIAEGSALLPLLEGARAVILVDAVAGMGPPGTVRLLSLEEVRDGSSSGGRSSHGVGAVEAIALARLLSPGWTSAAIRVVGVAIDPPASPRIGLSPEVEAAVPRAAAAVRALLRALNP